MNLLYKTGKLILDILKHYIFILGIAYLILVITGGVLNITENSVHSNIFILSYHELFDDDSVLGLVLKFLVAIIYIIIFLVYKLIKKMKKIDKI